MIDGAERTQGSFSAYEIIASATPVRYLGIFWPEK